MKNKNIFKSSFFILILILVPLMITIVAASWIMLSEDSVKPVYNPDSAFYKYLNGQSVVYNGTEQLPVPKSTPDGEEDSNLLYMGSDRVTYDCYRLESSGYQPYMNKLGNPTPMDYGTYLLRFSDNSDESIYESSDVEFTITKAKIYCDGGISCNYPDDTKQYFLTSTNVSNISYNTNYYFNALNDDGTTKIVPVTGSISLNEALVVGNEKYDFTFTPTTVESPYDINSLELADEEISLQITVYATVTFYSEGKIIDSLTLEVPKKQVLQTISDPSSTNNEQEEFLYWINENNDSQFVSEMEITNDTKFSAKWKYKTHYMYIDSVCEDKNGNVYYSDQYLFEKDKTTYSSTTIEIVYTYEDIIKGIVIVSPTNTKTSLKYFKNFLYTYTNENGKTVTKTYNSNFTINETNFSLEKDFERYDTIGNNIQTVWDDIIIINSDNPVQISYSSNLGFSDIKANIYSSNTLIHAYENYLGYTYDFTEILTINYIHNGYYYYNSTSTATSKTEIDEIDLISSTYVAGSTYVGNTKLTTSSSKYIILYDDVFITDKDKSVNLTIKYKTAIYNSTYYTIEDAIKAAGSNGNTITLIGNSTNTTSYVETCFSNINFSNLLDNYSLAYSLNNTKLLIPFKNSTDEKVEGSNNGDKVYSALTIPDNITINVTNSSNIVIGGEIAHTNTKYATKICVRGVLNNMGNIIVYSGCSIKSYGFTKGTGEINLLSGSSATDCMTTYDWPGGTAAVSIVGSLFPVNAWSMHNISCPTKINSGAYYYAHLYATMTGATISVDVNIVNKEGSNCLFYTKDTESYIYKYAVPADLWTNNISTYKTEYNSLSSIAGNNQTIGNKDVLKLKGKYYDSTFSISFKYVIDTGWFPITIPVEIKTSKSISCPIPFLDIILESNSYLSLSKADYLFLPGSSLTVAEGATLETTSGVDLSFETYNHTTLKAGNRKFGDICVDKNDAEFILNGTAKIAGNIGGLIKTESTLSKLTITGTNTSSFKSLLSTESPRSYSVKNYYARGYISNISTSNESTLTNFVTNVEYTGVLYNDIYYWYGTVGGVTVDSLYGNLTT